PIETPEAIGRRRVQENNRRAGGRNGPNHTPVDQVRGTLESENSATALQRQFHAAGQHANRAESVAHGLAWADEVGGLLIERHAAHEYESASDRIQRRNDLIRIRARSVLEERSPLDLSPQSVESTAVADRVRQDLPSLGWLVLQGIVQHERVGR